MLRYTLLLTLTVILATCSGTSSHTGHTDADSVAVADTVTHAAALLTIVDYPDYWTATISAPWSSQPLARYAMPTTPGTATPAGYTRLASPLQRSAVMAQVYSAAACELGAADAIAALADVEYLPQTDSLRQRVADGRIADIGSSMAPLAEKIIDLSPDAVLMSSFEDLSVAKQIEKFGIPVVAMTDYLEPTPLGRAEWIRLVGRLYGRAQEADSIYSAVEARYNDLAAKAAYQLKVKVVVEKPMSGVWYVPGGRSYMARLLDDAGALYPWADDTSTGSIPLDAAAVIDRAADAPVWLIKDIVTPTATSLAADVNHTRAFKAFPGSVYVCNTITSPYYTTIAFHPDTVLADFIAILHPNIAINHTPTFYHLITNN